MAKTYENELKERRLVDLHESLFPAVNLIRASLIELLLMTEFAKLDNLCQNASLDVAHRDFVGVLLVDVFEHVLYKVNFHGDRLLHLEDLAVAAFQLEGNRGLGHLGCSLERLVMEGVLMRKVLSCRLCSQVGRLLLSSSAVGNTARVFFTGIGVLCHETARSPVFRFSKKHLPDFWRLGDILCKPRPVFAQSGDQQESSGIWYCKHRGSVTCATRTCVIRCIVYLSVRHSQSN